jgi:hypothetical protein
MMRLRSLVRAHGIALALALSGVILLLVVWPNGGPLAGLYGRDTFDATDLGKSYVAAIAAMHDPIDWAHPLAISTLRYPFGTSLLLADALPLLTLPLRIAWQAGLTFDPTIALDLWVAAMVVISPFALYRLARAIGASRAAAFAAVGLGALHPALRTWFTSDGPPYGSQGLASWPLFALLVAELAAVESRSPYRRWVAPLLAAGLWWANPYLGLAGALLTAVHGVRAIPARRLVPLLPLIGSSIGVFLLVAADLPVPEGFAIERFDAFLSIIPGMLPGELSLAFPRDWWVWDGASALLLLVSLPLLWRRAPLLTVGTLLLVGLSLGSSGEGGGLFPASFYRATPLGLIEGVDRLFLPAALLGIAAAPSLVERLFRRGRTASVGRAAPLIASLVLIAGLGWVPDLAGSAARPGTPLGGLADPGPLVARGPVLAAVADLIGEHEALLFLPDTAPDCELPSSRVDRERYFAIASQKMGLAGLAGERGVPAYSFYVSRMFYRTDEAAAGYTIHAGTTCRHTREAPPARTLVVSSTLLDEVPPREAPWRAIVEQLPHCSGAFTSAPIEGLRFCSDDAAALKRFESRMRSVDSRSGEAGMR